MLEDFFVAETVYTYRQGNLFFYERSALLFLLLDDIICELVGWPWRRQSNTDRGPDREKFYHS